MHQSVQLVPETFYQSIKIFYKQLFVSDALWDIACFGYKNKRVIYILILKMIIFQSSYISLL